MYIILFPTKTWLMHDEPTGHWCLFLWLLDTRCASITCCPRTWHMSCNHETTQYSNVTNQMVRQNTHQALEVNKGQGKQRHAPLGRHPTRDGTENQNLLSRQLSASWLKKAREKFQSAGSNSNSGKGRKSSTRCSRPWWLRRRLPDPGSLDEKRVCLN